MKVHNCPSCNTYSRECIIVIQNALNYSEEILKCSICSWSGKWSDMKVREIPDDEPVPGVEPITDYGVLHSDTARITYTGGLGMMITCRDLVSLVMADTSDNRSPQATSFHEMTMACLFRLECLLKLDEIHRFFLCHYHSRTYVSF